MFIIFRLFCDVPIMPGVRNLTILLSGTVNPGRISTSAGPKRWSRIHEAMHMTA